MISIQKLRDMNLHAVADELEQLREFKAEVESQEPVGLIKTIGGYPDESEHTVKWLVNYRELKDGQSLYAKPAPADKPARITEQDMQEIANHIFGYIGVLYPESAFENWFSKFGGCELLNKLNADRQAPAESTDWESAFDEFIASIGGLDSDAWHDYPADDVFRKGYVAALKVEQEPAVAVPDEWRRIVERAANMMRMSGVVSHKDSLNPLHSWLHDAESLLDAPSHSQQSADTVTEGFKVIPELPHGFNHSAYNRNTGEWVYLNHANTWQLFQGPITDRCPSHESEQSASPAPDSEG